MKPVPAIEYPIHELFLKRWSPRAFSEKPISSSDIHSLFEAERWAPSCFNEQPWRFVYVQKGQGEYDRFLGCLVEQNQLWAKTAPMITVACAKTTFDRNKKPNPYAWYDTGMAVMCFTLEAISRGIFVHQMGGFLRDQIRTVANIPEGFDPVSMFVCGYMGDTTILPEPLAKQEKAPQERLDISYIVFTPAWETGNTGKQDNDDS